MKFHQKEFIVNSACSAAYFIMKLADLYEGRHYSNFGFNLECLKICKVDYSGLDLLRLE